MCTYDHFGVAWSDPGPTDTCTLRVSKIHSALRNSKIEGPYVLVGHSLGALVSRLYGSEYPDEVADMVIVDHASAVVWSPFHSPDGRSFFRGSSSRSPNSEDTLIATTDSPVTQSDSDFQNCPRKTMNFICGETLCRSMRTRCREIDPPPGTNKINHLRSSLNNQLLNAEMQGTNLGTTRTFGTVQKNTVATDTQGTNTSR